MSKEVNTNRGYYETVQNMYYSSNKYSDGAKSGSYTKELPSSVNPKFSKDVDMRQLNYAATNYATDSYNSAWSINTREANRAPLNTFSSYSTSSSNIGGDTRLQGEGHCNYGRSGGIQGPVSTSKVGRSTYADSFVTFNINNQDPMPTLQQQTRERDTVSDIVNPMQIQNYYTQKSVPDSNISSGQPLWQNKEKNASITVVPAAVCKGRPQNPDDLRFVLFPKEPTFNVKIIGGVRIAQKVTKISYRNSLKSTIVYTIGRKGGSCKKALAEGKRKRALWWISQGKTTEEAILLCLRPYHEIYEEFLQKKHTWDNQMMIRNLLVQINKEGVYNPFIGQLQANDSETSDDSADEETQQFNKTQDEFNQGYPSTNNKLEVNVQQNLGHNSNNLMLSSLPTLEENIQNMPTQQEIGNSSSQNASYDPKSHFFTSLADLNRPLPDNSESVSNLIHTKTDNYSRSSLADRDRKPVNSKQVSKFIYTNKHNPYTKVNTKTQLKKNIEGAALRRYYYWLNAGKTPQVAMALCVVRMDQIPLYQQIKGTVGSLKNFVKRSRYQARCGGILSVADTGPPSVVNKAGYCGNTNDSTENVHVENPQEELESFIPENTECTANGLQNPNTSKTEVYLKEIEQFIKSVKYGSKTYKHIFEPVAIDRYRWWRHVGRTVNEAQEMCLYPFYCYPKEHKEGVKIIDFKTYILENGAKLNIADETAKCPTKIKGHAKVRFNFWIKLGKTRKEAIDLTLQDSMPQQRQRQYMERVNKRQEYLSTLWSSGQLNSSVTKSSQNKNNFDSSSVSIIPTIEIQPTNEEEFTKDTDDYDVAHTEDYKNNIHTCTKSTEDNAKKQVEIATQLTNAEMMRFEWWKKQGKSEEEARNLGHKSMAVSEALNHIPSYKKERDVAFDTYEGSKSKIPDLSQNPEILGENAIKTETNSPQNIVAQEGHNLPITQNLVVSSNVKGSEQGEFRVCIKANKVKIDFDNLKAIKNCLDLCIADENGIKIKNINKRSNRVIITCLNEQTRDWLDKQIPTLVPWENAQLEIIDEDEIPTDILARFFVPFDTEEECCSVTPVQYMQQLHEQNPDVGCDRWIVHKVETKTDPIGVFVLGRIDNKSNDVLTSKNNKLKWFDKRNINVKLSSTKKKKRKAESAARAVLFVPKVPDCRLHSSQQYLLNRLHKLNPTVGCDGWTIVQKRIKPDGAALLVRLNNTSKRVVENKKKLRWYGSHNIEITIVPIYVNINFPIDNESKYLRNIPQNQITKTLINKLHFFNPSFGCFKWVVVQLQDQDDEWHLTFKINEQCHLTLINSDYKLYWYGGRWLEIKLGTVPELEMFKSKNDTKHSKKPATSYEPKENVNKRNLNQIASESMLSPQLMVNEESKVQDRGLPPSMLRNNPENRPDIAMLSSSRLDHTADVSYTEREPYHYERHNRAGSDCNETHQLSPAVEYAMPEITEYARPPYPSTLDRHGQGYLGLVGFGEKEVMPQERYSHGIRRYDDEDIDTGLEDRYRLESSRDAYYPEHRNVENVDYNNDCNQKYYKNENRQKDEESRHLPHQNPDNIANADPRSNDEYMDQDIKGYHFDGHHHDTDTREIDYVREERKLDRGERHFHSDEKDFDRDERDFDRGDSYFDREENNFNREGRNFNTEERYCGRGGINFESGQRYFDREKSSQDGAPLHLGHRSRQETQYFQREWSPDHQNRNKYVDRRKRSHSRDDQWRQNLPYLRPEHREALHDSRKSLNQNKRARVSEDRRHDAPIDRLKGLADYHDREYHYQESSSYSNDNQQNLRPRFDKPASKRRRRRR